MMNTLYTYIKLNNLLIKNIINRFTNIWNKKEAWVVCVVKRLVMDLTIAFSAYHILTQGNGYSKRLRLMSKLDVALFYDGNF